MTKVTKGRFTASKDESGAGGFWPRPVKPWPKRRTGGHDVQVKGKGSGAERAEGHRREHGGAGREVREGACEERMLALRRPEGSNNLPPVCPRGKQQPLFSRGCRCRRRCGAMSSEASRPRGRPVPVLTGETIVGRPGAFVQPAPDGRPAGPVVRVIVCFPCLE